MERKLKKKGTIEVQFNWIFVIILGAMILLFFGTVALKAKKNHEISLSDQVLTKIEAIFTGAELSEGTVNILETPELKIGFTCDTYSIITSKNMKNRLIFAPPTVEGKRILTWTIDWNIPYTASNFLIVTTPTNKYWVLSGFSGNPTSYDCTTPTNDILKKTNCFAKSIYEDQVELSLSDNITKGLGDSGNIDDLPNENYDRVRITIFTTNPSRDPPNIPTEIANKMKKSEKLTALVVVPESNTNFETGVLYFYKYNGNTFEPIGPIYPEEGIPYLGRASLIAAMFIEDPETYSCLMDRAMTKLSLINSVYYYRTQQLFQLTDPSYQKCNYQITEIDKNKIIIEKLTQNGRYAKNNVDDYYTTWKGPIGLEQKNKDLEKRSCPELY